MIHFSKNRRPFFLFLLLLLFFFNLTSQSNTVTANMEPNESSVSLIQTKTTEHLYSFPNDESKKDMTIPIGMYSLTEGYHQNHFYQIDTSLGKYWIKPTEFDFLLLSTKDSFIETKLRTFLFDDFPLQSQTTHSIAPQWVKITKVLSQFSQQTNEFEPISYGIETWIGEKWISSFSANPSATFQTTIYPFLNSNEVLYLHDYPDGKSVTSSYVSPQPLEVLLKQNDFLLIQTWLGPKWIKCQSFVEGEITVSSQSLLLSKRTALYDFPFDNALIRGELEPQSVFSHLFLEESSFSILHPVNYGWYLIDTWLGPKWIKYDSVTPVSIFNGQVHTSTYLDLYNSFHLSSKTNQSINPQLVTIKGRVGNWLKISTWMGDRYINLSLARDTATPTYPSQTIHLIGDYSLFSEPNDYQPPITHIQNSTQVTVTDIIQIHSKIWAKISYQSKFYWVDITDIG